MNNYNITSEDGIHGLSVCAFDNDNPLTFWVTTPKRFSCIGTGELFSAKGINLPYISRSMYEILKNYDGDCLRSKLNRYLNIFQINGVLSRMDYLIKEIDHSVFIGSTSIIDDSQWSQETLNRELSGDYGRTYMCNYNEHCKDICDRVF